MLLNSRRFLIALLTLALFVPALGITPAQAARHHRKHVIHREEDRFAEIVIEASSGYVLSEKNADKRLYPASLSKLMTLYLTFDALDEGRLSKRQYIPISRHAASQEPSALGLTPGDSIRVEDCIYGIATKSANDCAVVLGEAIGGSEERFGALMTAKARQLGMRNSHFVNASGLFNKQQYSTARDMAILARALIRNHPRYYHYFSTQSFTWNGQVMANHNHLMSSYRGMDGLKTGYVYASGYNLAASAVRNGTRLIGVIFGGRTARSRNNAMAQLLNQSFARVSDVRVASLVAAEPVTLPQRTIVPAQRPMLPTEAVVTQQVAANNTAPAAPRFNSMGLAVDQGDADINANNDPAPQNNSPPMLRPQPVNVIPMVQQAAVDNQGSWAIQIGSFSSHDASEQALQSAKASLRGTVNGSDSIAPLMTPRGMIYRARLSGLSHSGAVQACGILKGNCVIMSVE